MRNILIFILFTSACSISSSNSKDPDTSPKDPSTSPKNSVVKNFNKNYVGLPVLKSDTKNLSEKLNKTVWKTLNGQNYSFSVFLLDKDNRFLQNTRYGQSYEFIPSGTLYDYNIIKDTPTELQIQDDNFFIIYGLVANNKIYYNLVAAKHHSSATAYNTKIKTVQDEMTVLLATTEDTSGSSSFDKTKWIYQNIIDKEQYTVSYNFPRNLKNYLYKYK